MLSKLINEICKELPDDFKIILELENGSATPKLLYQEQPLTFYISPELTLEEELQFLLSEAIKKTETINCESCKGSGKLLKRMGYEKYFEPCPDCFGTGKLQICIACGGKKILLKEGFTVCQMCVTVEQLPKAKVEPLTS